MRIAGHKAQCASLTKAVEKLQYENELIELRNNPVGEELDVSHLHQETDELKRANASKVCLVMQPCQNGR